MQPPSGSSEGRTKHPYFTYDMILGQPACLDATISKCERERYEIRQYFSGIDELILIGCGTSFHAAIATVGMTEELFERTRISARESFELLNYFRNTKGKALVTAFTHTGNTKTTIDAINISKSRGARTLALTGSEGSRVFEVADRAVLIGDGPERSRAHTKSYLASVMAAVYFSLDHLSAESQTKGQVSGLLDQLKRIPDFASEALQSEKQVENFVASLIEKWRNISLSRKIFFVGAGPNIATALEAALKIKETCYESAEGMELEQFLHGPWVSLDENSLVVPIAPKGASRERFLDLLNVCHRLQVRTLAITDDKEIEELASESVRMGEVSEVLTPVTYIIPLQMFAYYLSVQKGLNPDLIHYDDPKVWETRQIVFPPGTH
jgi:glucosamine--fructose-6-phosphate aminotransferase (isomerizing)